MRPESLLLFFKMYEILKVVRKHERKVRHRDLNHIYHDFRTINTSKSIYF